MMKKRFIIRVARRSRKGEIIQTKVSMSDGYSLISLSASFISSNSGVWVVIENV